MTSTVDLSPIAREQIPAAGEALARAFSNAPLCVYTQPDPEARITQVHLVLHPGVREEVRRQGVDGAVYSNRVDGVASGPSHESETPVAEDAPASEIPDPVLPPSPEPKTIRTDKCTPTHPLGLGHAAISVRDPNRVAAFYRALLDLQIVRDGGNALTGRTVLLSGDPAESKTVNWCSSPIPAPNISPSA